MRLCYLCKNLTNYYYTVKYIKAIIIVLSMMFWELFLTAQA